MYLVEKKSKILEAAIPLPRGFGGVFATLKKHKVIGGKQVFKRGTGKSIKYYVWDYLHGHWEVYSKKGVNLSSITNNDDVVDYFKKKDNRGRLAL